jgi:hypothetical protein
MHLAAFECRWRPITGDRGGSGALIGGLPGGDISRATGWWYVTARREAPEALTGELNPRATGRRWVVRLPGSGLDADRSDWRLVDQHRSGRVNRGYARDWRRCDIDAEFTLAI